MNQLLTDIDLDRARNLTQLLFDSNIDQFTINGMYISKLFDGLVKSEKISKAEINLKVGYCELQTSNTMYFGPEYLFTFFQAMCEVQHIPLKKNFAEYFILLLSFKLNENELVDLIAMIVSTEHNLVSLGQALAMTRRVISIPLSAQQRTQLSRLRKKVEEANHLVQSFGFLIGNSHRQKELGEVTLRFICNICQATVKLNNKIIERPVHCEQPMSLIWSNLPVSADGTHHLDKIPNQSGIEELMQKIETGLDPTPIKSIATKHVRKLVCQVCAEEFEIDHELNKLLLKSNEPIPLPQHHGIPMKLEILSTETSKEKSKLLMVNFRRLMKNLEKLDEDPKSFKYYYCKVCYELMHTKETKIPKHHGKNMNLLHFSFN